MLKAHPIAAFVAAAVLVPAAFAGDNKDWSTDAI
jgi:hypothetical protein